MVVARFHDTFYFKDTAQKTANCYSHASDYYNNAINNFYAKTVRDVSPGDVICQIKKMPTREVHTSKFTKGPRTYFFDVSKSGHGYYLRMSCSEKGRESFAHHRLFVFEEDLALFTAALTKSVDAVNQLKSRS